MNAKKKSKVSQNKKAAQKHFWEKFTKDQQELHHNIVRTWRGIQEETISLGNLLLQMQENVIKAGLMQAKNSKGIFGDYLHYVGIPSSTGYRFIDQAKSLRKADIPEKTLATLTVEGVKLDKPKQVAAVVKRASELKDSTPAQAKIIAAEILKSTKVKREPHTTVVDVVALRNKALESSAAFLGTFEKALDKVLAWEHLGRDLMPSYGIKVIAEALAKKSSASEQPVANTQPNNTQHVELGRAG
jgi:hypothetical protein